MFMPSILSFVGAVLLSNPAIAALSAGSECEFRSVDDTISDRGTLFRTFQV